MQNISPSALACNLCSDSCYPLVHCLMIKIPDKPKKLSLALEFMLGSWGSPHQFSLDPIDDL